MIPEGTTPDLTEAQAADVLDEIEAAITAGRAMGRGAWATVNHLRRLLAPEASKHPLFRRTPDNDEVPRGA